MSADFALAACKGTLDPWFPVQGARQAAERAKAVCHTCPCEAACLEGALERGERSGIWGGTSYRERVVLLRRRAQA